MKLKLGDSELLMPTIPEGKVDVVVTDPPYGIGFPYLSYEDTRESLQQIIKWFIPQALRIAKQRVVVLCGPTQISLYPQADWVGAVTWNTTGSHGKCGFNQWTPVLIYGKDVEGFARINGMLKSDVLPINGGAGVGFQRSEREKRHTCPKPLNMMCLILHRYTLPGDVVLDPFMGSGTTGVAAKMTGRKFIGIERDVEYFDLAKRRIESTDAGFNLGTS
jgi:DNA modification methylase